MAAAARCGFSLPDLLRNAGIRVQGDVSHDGLPPNASVDGLLRLLDAARPVSLNACFPLALADSFRFEFFPEAETFLQSSRSLRAAMVMLPLIPSVVLPGIVFTIHEAGEKTAVRLTLEAQLQGPAHEDLALLAFAIMHRLVTHLLPIAPDGIVLNLRQPAGLWQELSGNNGYVQAKGDDLYRRSLYTFWRRTCPPPLLSAFDAPSREFCLVQREESLTPLQTLAVLNDAGFLEAARVLAGRVLAGCGADRRPLGHPAHLRRLAPRRFLPAGLQRRP